jgi:adenylate cyclase class 2
MTLEIEAKLKVEAHQDVRARLLEADGQFVRAVTEVSHFYDADEGRLRASDSVLRIRHSTVHRGADAPSTLTYKGPRLPGHVKRRTEIDLKISDPRAAGELLETLGFNRVSTIEKRRETWALDGCRIELDEVPHLGAFVEIEGPDEAAIGQVQDRLGLARHPHIDSGYVSLLVRYCRQHDLPVDFIGFSKNPATGD